MLNFNYYEIKALYNYLKKTIDKENLSYLSNEDVNKSHLLLAYVKLQREVEYWNEAFAYTE